MQVLACANRLVAGTVGGVIGYLEGDVRGQCIVCGGVGYTVATPHILDEGAHVSLHVTTVVSEGAISLYGFSTPGDQAVFGALRRVQGVGPQLALALLRDVGAGNVVRSIRDRDPAALVAAQGVGGRLAERIVAGAVIDDWVVAAVEADGDGEAGVSDELARTLESLGFPLEASIAAVREVLGEHPDADDQALLAGAMARLREQR